MRKQRATGAQRRERCFRGTRVSAEWGTESTEKRQNTEARRHGGERRRHTVLRARGSTGVAKRRARRRHASRSAAHADPSNRRPPLLRFFVFGRYLCHLRALSRAFCLQNAARAVSCAASKPSARLSHTIGRLGPALTARSRYASPRSRWPSFTNAVPSTAIAQGWPE